MTGIVINEKIRHGKPIIEGTRITVDEVMAMLETGMTYEEIEREYGLKKKQVLSAIKYTTSFVSGQEIHRISVT